MVWAAIKDWFGSGSSDDRRELSEEIEKVRKQVLGERRKVETVEKSLKTVKGDIEDHREAIEHIIDAIKQQEEANREYTGSIDVEGLEERVKILENRFDAAFESVSTTDRTSGRTSKRLNEGGSDQSAVEETAQEAVEGQELWERATKAQKRIIRAMFELGYPATYKEIASDVGKSVSTVKNHINNLKSLGFDFKEEEGPNNSKKYSLDERLRAFMTVRLND